MYYTLLEPWALRGYRGHLLYLEAAGFRDRPRPISAALFFLLCRCDGKTPLTEMTETEAETLRRLEAEGIVRSSRVPMPCQPWQEYRFYDNRRVLSAAWGITGRCNARCRHCFMGADTEETPCEFTWEECQRLIGEMEECGIRSVMLTGGEPLIHPDFFRIVHAIAEKGMRVSRIYTNALKLTEETIQRLEAEGQRPEMMISFDGLGVHEWMRRVPGAEEKALKAIALCRTHGLPIRVSMNLNTVTLPSAEATVRRMAGMGVETIFIIRTTPTPKWLNQESSTLGDDEYMETQLKLIRILRENRAWKTRIRFFNGLEVGPDTTAASLSRPNHRWLSDEVPESAWCAKCVESFFVASDGRVLPCDAFEGGSISGGFLLADNNVHRRPLREILNDSEYSRMMLLSQEELLEHNPKCQACPWQEVCQGGICRACGIAALAVRAGSYHGVDPLEGIRTPDPIQCRFYRGGYFDRLKEMLEKDEALAARGMSLTGIKDTAVEMKKSESEEKAAGEKRMAESGETVSGEMRMEANP